MEKIGEKICSLRKSKGLSQENLAFEIGVARQTVSQWENDTLKPKYENILALCEVFNVGADYFLSSDNTPKIKNSEIAVTSSRENGGDVIEMQEQKPRPQKLSGKTKLLIVLLAVFAVLVAAVAVILVCLFTYHEEGFETIQSISFGLTHNGRIAVTVIAAVILIAISIALIIWLIKRNKTKISAKHDKNVK